MLRSREDSRWVMKTVVEVESLQFSYPDGTLALKGMTLSVREGERVALMGPNGAGKSTLLLHLNGIFRGDGSVKVDGVPVEKGTLKAVRQKVGLVFQNPDDQLFCPTVFEDVAFGPRNLGLDAEEVERRVEESLTAVQMLHAARKSPFRLSFGEKKKVAIATVLALRPSVLVIDEPTANLDPRGRRGILALLRDLGGTQVVATHDLALTRELCGRTIVLDAGEKVADGDTLAILEDKSLLEQHGLL
jgi:cobalt/nickel transport system ATP-binding protein